MSNNQTTLPDFLQTKVVGHRTRALQPPLPRVRSPVWKIDKSQALSENWVEFLRAKMGVAFELEYNYKWETTCTKSWQNELNHERNMIHDIHDDPTLASNEGQEFVIEALPQVSSEEFAARLPMKVFRDHFETGGHCGMHTHVIVLPYGKHKPVPIQIAKNGWQLFRAFYPGWIHLFGNYPKRLLRSRWATWKNNFIESPTKEPSWGHKSWATTAAEDKRHNGGISFEDCKLMEEYEDDEGRTRQKFEEELRPTLTKFDAEIRVSDSTHELDQIVACRALSKALFLRSADLATVGVIDLPDAMESQVMEIARDVQSSIQDRFFKVYDVDDGVDDGLEARQGQAMRSNAVAFVREMQPYLTPYEMKQVRSCLINPVRRRGVVKWR